MHAAFADCGIPLQIATRRGRNKYDFIASRFEKTTAKKAGFGVYWMGRGKKDEERWENQTHKWRLPFSFYAVFVRLFVFWLSIPWFQD